MVPLRLAPASPEAAGPTPRRNPPPLSQPERYKTTMCRHVGREACFLGARCRFAHSPEDLRTEAQNIRDGITTEDAVRQLMDAAEAAAAARGDVTATTKGKRSHGAPYPRRWT